ncbi:hypothetical protein GIY23_09255 [Allosaccharopolyspora coralli]|uniref:Putative T7SS secretion signal domain-containing protein n=1 Tax=Allosaccharopolyspora coralli TaxID=2665642 RepID=A0A5Q3Q4Y3_9PSEU|nr:ADP-ribosyltransferase [Allosaccharopolyspora coralli]QGK69681.1 hypothetical protein GIY23_09255 [Allosaccharopolyspora coralli]
MVTNDSSLGEDWNNLVEWGQDTLTDAGQAVGLIDEDLVPGDPAATGELAEFLTTLGSAFERAAQGFKKVDTGGWHGQAADAAHDYLNVAVPKWFTAADAYADAGKAVADYQKVLAEAKPKAQRAKEDLERAEAASEAAREAHDAKVEGYNTAVASANAGGPPPGAAPGSFTDPAAGDRAAAQQTIADAQAAAEDAGERAAAVVRAAAEQAPPEPGLLTRLKENLVDGTQNLARGVGSFYAGVGESVLGMGMMLRQNPLDPYYLLHPAEYGEAQTTMAMGLVSAVQDPYAAAKTVVNVDGWRNDPARAAGAMVPDALLSLAGGAGAASRLGRGAHQLADAASDLGTAGRRMDDLPPPSRTGPDAHTPAQQPQPPSPSNPPPAPWETGGTKHWQPTPLHHTPDNGMGADRGLPDAGANSDRLAPPVERTPDPGPSPDHGANSDRIAPQSEPPSSPNAGESKYPEHSPTTALDEPAQQGLGDRGPDGNPAAGERSEVSAEDRQSFRDRVENRMQTPWEENVARVREEHPELAHLDDEKAVSLRRYVGVDANTLNHTLREGDAFDQNYMNPEVNLLRGALDDMPRVNTADTPEAYRDMAVSDDALGQILERYRPGETIEEPGFTSASKEPPPDYFTEHGADKPNKVRFTIEDPQHARDLESLNPTEREVLFQNGNRFQVEQLKQVGDEIHIHMRDKGQ